MDGAELFVGEVEGLVLLPILIVGDDVDVCVGDVGADDFDDGALTCDGLEVLRELFDRVPDGVVVIVGELVELVDLNLGYDEGVALGLWGDVEEGASLGIFVNFVGWELAGDDTSENSGH